MTLGPIVAHSVCEYLPVRIEATFRDRLLHGFGRFQLGASVFVPETECAVRSDCGQGAMHGMEGDVVDRINVLNVRIRVHAMTFECKIVLWIHWIHLKINQKNSEY